MQLKQQINPKSASTYRNHLSFGGQVGWPVAEPQFGLQGVEVGLKPGLLLHTRGLVHAPVVAELVQLLVHSHQGVVGCSVFQPWGGSSDPF